MKSARIPALFILLFLLSSTAGYSQCGLGQDPASAFPVCGTSVFEQKEVPLCNGGNINVPGCGSLGVQNPYWYKFTCFQSGTLGFLIQPKIHDEDYDWQLFDITGHHPEEVFTDPTLAVTANWAGTYGNTGASNAGVSFVQCGSDPNEQPPKPTFAGRPQLIAGHQYLLLISHFTNSQSGYDLSFGGGTAVITDPTDPHLQKASALCDGMTLTVKLNKKIKCTSLSADGSEFSISPASVNVVSATSNCAAFDFDEVTLTLSSPLPNGGYQLVVKTGSDGNTLLDNCEREIPVNEQTPFQYAIPQPIFADSIGGIGCAPDLLRIYFPKKLDCATIASNGSDFTVTGPGVVTVIGAGGDNCVANKSDVILVRLASPIAVKGTYTLQLKTGTDGNTTVDECGLEAPVQTLTFDAVDTVSAAFTYTSQLDCRFNTLQFIHDGAHDVTSWNWTFNGTETATTPSHTIVFPATSNNTVRLIVSNGICSDTTQQTVVMDNEVKAAFEMPDVICPEDPLVVTNTNTGLIDTWQWKFGSISSSMLENPAPVNFPTTNIETNYSISLKVSNTTLNCSDSVKKTLRVLNNCFIAVPTAFTPNNDGKNDFLYPNNAIKAEKLDFRVYNRWGQLVFHSNDWTQKWDGKLNGIPQAAGVYVWLLSYIQRDTGQPVFQKGTTTLIR